MAAPITPESVDNNLGVETKPTSFRICSEIVPPLPIPSQAIWPVRYRTEQRHGNAVYVHQATSETLQAVGGTHSVRTPSSMFGILVLFTRVKVQPVLLVTLHIYMPVP